MNQTQYKRLVVLEQSIPPPPVVILLLEEWEALLSRHDGSHSKAIREIGSEPVLVPDEETRIAGEEMFNDPLNPNFKIVLASVWEKVVETNNGCPAVLMTTPFVVCANEMTYEALAAKRPEIREFGIGLTEEEKRVLEERKAIGTA